MKTHKSTNGMIWDRQLLREMERQSQTRRDVEAASNTTRKKYLGGFS